MRTRMLAMLARHAGAGARVLDLGCGPGTDLPELARAGYQVTAIDASEGMVRQARDVASRIADGDPPRIERRAIEELYGYSGQRFDAAFSNFGPLNCVQDLASVARVLSAVLRPGGTLVASVVGRVCPWEVALYLARGDVRRAFVRFHRDHVPVPLQGQSVWTQYESPGRFARTFVSAGFGLAELAGLGVVAPPPYLEAFARRHPRMTASLLAADAAVGAWPVVRHVGDHFAIALRRE